MYGPGSYPQWPPYPPQSNVVYIPVPTAAPTKGGKGRKGWKNPPLDPLTEIAKAKDNLEKLEKLFKKEEKKDDKKDGGLTKKQFSFLETLGLQFVLWLPTSFMIWGGFKMISILLAK